MGPFDFPFIMSLQVVGTSLPCAVFILSATMFSRYYCKRNSPRKQLGIKVTQKVFSDSCDLYVEEVKCSSDTVSPKCRGDISQ